MIKALAPGMRRGCSWVWLSIALAVGFPPAARAQESSKKKAEPAAEKKAEAEAPAEEAVEEETQGTVEVFKDPRAEAALKVFKNVPGLMRPRGNPADLLSRVRAMAGNPNATLDRDEIQRFVSGMAYELTDKTNINALINPPDHGQRGRATRAVQEATDALLDVLNTARQANNAAFLNVYRDVLVDTLPKLLDNNLISRIQAMIVLGQTNSLRAVPVFVAQVKNPEQTFWVKLWALRGLSSVVDEGVKVDALAAQSIDVGKAIADFLDREKDVPWPVQMRALQALGAMRQAAVANDLKNVQMATTAMRFLADANQEGFHPEVRAAAARAMGMFRVNQAIKKYNYALVAYDIGQLAADLGEEINDSFDENRTLSEYLTALLVSPIHQAFYGVDGARDSGLLKVPGGYPELENTRKIADLSSAVARAAVELLRAGGGQVGSMKKTLGDRVAALKGYLEKNPPKEYSLVPKGPEFRPAQAQVAGAPVDKPKVAGVRGAR